MKNLNLHTEQLQPQERHAQGTSYVEFKGIDELS